MRYCDVKMIKANQHDVVLKTDKGEGINCRVLVGGKEDIICECMPDNLKFEFKKFCDGCNRFEIDVSYAFRDEDDDRVRIMCKHLPACSDLEWRLSE